MSSLPTCVTKDRPLHGDREQVSPTPTASSSVPEVVVVAVDARGELAFVNDAGKRLAQRLVAPDVLPEQGGALFRLCRPDGMLMPPDETPLACALRCETAVEIQGILPTLEGSNLQVTVTASPVRDEQGSIVGAVAVFRDASGPAAVESLGLAYEELAARMLVAQQEAERDRAVRNDLQARYEELLLRDEELRHLQQAREEFVGSISHDLRAPITVIYGQAQFLQQLLDRAGLTGREQRPVNAILTSARHLNNMVKDLVDAARMQAGQMRLDTSPLDLH